MYSPQPVEKKLLISSVFNEIEISYLDFLFKK